MNLNGLPNTPAGHRLLQWQACALVIILGVTVLVPDQNSATLLLPFADTNRAAVLEREILQGAVITGSSPVGGIVLIHTQQGIGLRALRDGVLAIRIPENLCVNTRTIYGRPS